MKINLRYDGRTLIGGGMLAIYAGAFVTQHMEPNWVSIPTLVFLFVGAAVSIMVGCFQGFECNNWVDRENDNDRSR